jgi:transposase
MSGRPPLELTPERQQAICAAVAAGNNRQTAAAAAGISERTLRRWLQDARRRGEESPFWPFLAALKKAEAEAVVSALTFINRAARKGAWQAAAWWLERRYPEHWGRQRDEIRKLAKDLKELEQRLAGRLPPPGRPKK